MSKDKSESSQGQKLGLTALIAIVVSSMIGSGVDSLPQNMAQKSAVAPVVIAWLVCGVGMFFIGQTFVRLSTLKPDLQAGIYMYARAGFGELAAFIVGWGYWLMSIFSNVAFSVMVMDTLDYFMPGKFTGGNNLNSIIGASLLVWGFHALVLSGTKLAGGINLIGTVAKLIPLVFFIGVLMYFLDTSNITSNIWGHDPAISNPVLGSTLSQVLSPLFVALWCFIGIEGAVALSGRAMNSKDVGRATMVGFVISLFVCIFISILPFGILSQETLSALPNPSTAGVMKHVMGEWGEVFINIGVLISILSGWLAWTMICSEIPMVAAENGTFPKWFAKKNDKGAASHSLWVSSLMMQAVLFLVYFSHNAWLTLLAISSIMVLPAYFCSAAYLAKISIFEKNSNHSTQGVRLTLVVACVAIVFCLFMLYASNIAYVAMTPLLLSLGLPLLFFGKEKQNTNVTLVSKKEIMGLVVIACIDILVIYLYATDVISFP